MISRAVPTERRAHTIVYLLAASVGLMMTGYGIVMPVFARRLDELGADVATLRFMTNAGYLDITEERYRSSVLGIMESATALGGSNLMVVMASPPSSRSQAVPLQTERRAVVMIYNCSTRSSTPVIRSGPA